MVNFVTHSDPPFGLIGIDVRTNCLVPADDGK
jgi:hypothetical protein